MVEISRKPSDSKVSQLFLDPTGRHIIVTTDHGENYYLFHKWRRTKELAKLKVGYLPTPTPHIKACLGYCDFFNCMEQTSRYQQRIHTRNTCGQQQRHRIRNMFGTHRRIFQTRREICDSTIFTA